MARAFGPVVILILLGMLTGACAPIVSPAEPQADAQGVVAAPASDWPMEGRSPERSRTTADAVHPPLALAQLYKIGGDTQYASPVSVAQGALFADGDHTLHALAVDSATEQWRINLPGSFLSPAVEGDAVYVRAEAGDDGYLVALSRDGGAKLWEYKFPVVGSDYNNIGGHVTSPVVADGLVLVAASNQLSAFHAGSGDLAWSFAMEEPAASSATIADDLVFVADFLHLYALDLASGAERWRFAHDVATLYFAPVVAEDRVFITSNNLVYALDRGDGHILWSKQIGDLQLVPAAALGEQVYIKSANDLFAVNVADGRTRWEYAAGDFVSLPALTDQHAYVITRTGGDSQLRALQQNDGVEAWKIDEFDYSNAAPVVAGGRVYARTVDGQVAAYQPETR